MLTYTFKIYLTIQYNLYSVPNSAQSLIKVKIYLTIVSEDKHTLKDTKHYKCSKQGGGVGEHKVMLVCVR